MDEKVGAGVGERDGVVGEVSKPRPVTESLRSPQQQSELSKKLLLFYDIF